MLQRVVVAIKETVRLMSGIDKVIPIGRSSENKGNCRPVKLTPKRRENEPTHHGVLVSPLAM
jgi:hypothetical protein